MKPANEDFSEETITQADVDAKLIGEDVIAQFNAEVSKYPELRLASHFLEAVHSMGGMFGLDRVQAARVRGHIGVMLCIPHPKNREKYPDEAAAVDEGAALARLILQPLLEKTP